jgi:hypothetical protein
MMPVNLRDRRIDAMTPAEHEAVAARELAALRWALDDGARRSVETAPVETMTPERSMIGAAVDSLTRALPHPCAERGCAEMVRDVTRCAHHTHERALDKYRKWGLRR